MKEAFRIALLLLILGAAPPAFSEVVEKVVAVVNWEPITQYDVDKLMAENLEEIKKAAATGDQRQQFQNYRGLALEKLIGDKLIEQEMEKRNMAVTDADVQTSLEGIMKRNNLTKEQLEGELRKQGLTWSQYQVTLRQQLKKVKFMGEVLAPRVKITDADLDEFFAKHPDKFGAYQSVKMAQIIIPLDPAAEGAPLAEAQKTANEVASKAKGGNFEELGKKYSQNPQTAVASIYQVNQLAPAIAEALTELKPGQTSQPVRSAMGLHVLKLYERKTLAGDEYKQVREQLRERVFEEKLEEELEKFVNELKGKSYIEIKS
jgi:peptidyl-prolyl cis-trans isomerase SurA